MVQDQHGADQEKTHTRTKQGSDPRKLLEAAAIAFAREGFAGAAVEQIAESAGFSRGAFYSNFKSKDELFLAPNETQPKGLHGQ